MAGVAVAAFAAVLGAQSLIANSDRTRTLALYNIHTKETISVVYKQDGRYVPEAMKQINWMLRDWRLNEPTTMDPALIDLLWEVHTELGSKEPIHIISGFRSRNTNEMLRRTVGGQASESRHILGKAADVHFPDVPLKRLRYSALVRERGGVGYYPTSAIPFVHMDTDRVRAWPRLPRYELALLFPNGKTQHMPADGGPITKEDVRVAQARHQELATQVAAFHDFRNRPAGSTQVAALMQKPVSPAAAAAMTSMAAQLAQPAPAAAPQVVASLPPQAKAAVVRPAPEPKLVDRPSRLTQPTSDEREKLAQLAALALIEPQLVSGPVPAARPKPQLASLTGSVPQLPAPAPLPQASSAPKLAALAPEGGAGGIADLIGNGWGNGFVQAPAYDDEHPDELSYRPFPVAPYMTLTASADDPALAVMVHPDVAKTLELLDQAGSMPPMRLRPAQQVARLMWAQEFKGGMADIAALFDGNDGAGTHTALANRNVKTGGH